MQQRTPRTTRTEGPPVGVETGDQVAEQGPIPTQQRQGHQTSRTVRPRWRSLLIHGILIGGALVMLYPLMWMISASVKPASEIFSDPGLIPDRFLWSNYSDGWTQLQEPFSRFFWNSFLVTSLTVVGNVFSCAVVAYAFARLTFPLRRTWFALMLVTVMLPTHVTLIPQYILFFNLEWVNTYLPLIVPNFLATSTFFVFLFVQFIRGIPTEIDDAARVDGCGPYRLFFMIILPLMKPALVTAAILSAINSWDEFLGPLLYLSDVEKFTVPLALRLFLDQTGESSYGPMLAMSVLSLVPIFIVFIIFQRRIIQGIATTGIK